MNKMIKQSFSDGLNPYNYAASLMQEGKRFGYINEEEYASFLLECNELIKQQVLIENNFKTACIKETAANEIIASFFYCLDYSLQQMDYLDAIYLLKQGVRDVYEGHQKALLKEIQQTKQLYYEAATTKIKTKQKVYNELFDGKLYQGISRASMNHLKNLDLDYDYQIMHYDCRGNDVLSVKKYLIELIKENKYIKTFSNDDLQWLEKNYELQFNDNIEDSFVNIAELLFINFLGNKILGKEGIRLTKEDIDEMYKMDIQFLINENNIYSHRIQQAMKSHTLHNIFIYDLEAYEMINTNEGMLDYTYKEVVSQMERENSLEGKVDIMRSCMKSYGDFVDLIETFDFDEDELDTIYSMFSSDEIDYLYYALIKEYRIGAIEIDEDDVSELWQKRLIKKKQN